MLEAIFGKVLVLLRKGYYLIFEQLLSNEATVTSQWNFHNLFGFCKPLIMLTTTKFSKI